MPCFVPNCTATADFRLPVTEGKVALLCERHVREWHDSSLRKSLPEVTEAFGNAGARRLFAAWATTEAQGMTGDVLLGALDRALGGGTTSGGA